MEVSKDIGTEEQLVVFQLAEETYGISISNVHEIIRIQPITHIPKMPTFVEGVINLRGNIIPVIDLKKRFGLANTEHSNFTRIIVIEIKDTSFGMIVDAVQEVYRIASSAIEPPPAVFGGVSGEFFQGVGKKGDKLIVILNAEKILDEREKELLANSEIQAQE